jgi:hypothetical protein
LVLVVVAVVSPGVWVVIVESVDVDELAIGSGAGALAIGSGAVIAGSEAGGVDVLGDAGFGVVVAGAEVVGAPAVEVVCASAADESVMAAIAVRVAIRIACPSSDVTFKPVESINALLTALDPPIAA